MGKLFIVSGAGISAESGISTFRDKDGLWENHRIEEVCNIDTWRENYDMVHDFYNQRRTDLSGVEPNKAHHFVAELQHRLGVENVINITTNVDDLFERVGVKNTLYLHGEITKMLNTKTGEKWDIGYKPFETGSDQGKLVKPFVTFFGEIAPAYEELGNIRYFDINPDDYIVFIGMSFIVCPTYMFVPSNGCKTFNINPDVSTNEDDAFLKCYNTTASLGLEQFIEEFINENN